MCRLAPAFRILPCVLAACLAGGCSSGPDRHEVTGTVTLKGGPVDQGVITFVPQDGQGTQEGATIIKGDYRIPKDKGLFPGNYKIIILAGDGSEGGGNAEPGPGKPRPGAARGKERVPPEYNEKSNVIREVTKGGPNKFDFNIP